MLRVPVSGHDRSQAHHGLQLGASTRFDITSCRRSYAEGPTLKRTASLRVTPRCSPRPRYVHATGAALRHAISDFRKLLGNENTPVRSVRDQGALFSLTRSGR